MKTLAIALFAVFAPIHAIIYTVLALCISDLITGIMAARKRKEPITSAGIKHTVGKLFVYEVAICLGFLCETFLTGPLFPIVKIIAAIIGAAELKSNLENLDQINGSPIYSSLINSLIKDKTDVK